MPSATTPAAGSVRIGDRERAALADRLSGHAAAGRLSVEELEKRLERAYAAVFAHELEALEADLPAPRGRAERPRRPPPVAALAVALLVAALALSVAVGHPVAPPLIAAALLWRAARRTSHRPLVPGRSSA